MSEKAFVQRKKIIIIEGYYLQTFLHSLILKEQEINPALYFITIIFISSHADFKDLFHREIRSGSCRLLACRSVSGWTFISKYGFIVYNGN